MNVPREADVVLKFGGALLSEPAELTRAIGALDRPIARAIARAADRLRVVIVPGGGPFADAVRALEPSVSLGADAAHWMAILGMTQYGHLLTSRLRHGVLVDSLAGIRHALAAGALPVLAPYEWLRAADPLPHQWDVTSDSIAAWVARELRAPDLLLLKSVPGQVEHLADAYLPSFLQESAARGVILRVRTVIPGGLDAALSTLWSTPAAEGSLQVHG